MMIRTRRRRLGAGRAAGRARKLSRKRRAEIVGIAARKH